jgi:hypothetical protein
MSFAGRRRSGRAFGLVLLVIAMAIPASAESWKNVMLLDVMCSKLAHVMKNPPDHPRACILECHEDGYGVVLDNGDFLAFDGRGSKLAIEVLRSDDAPEENVRVNVVGKRSGNGIRVEKLTLVN